MDKCIICDKQTDNVGMTVKVSDHEPVTNIIMCSKCVDNLKHDLFADDEDEYKLLVKAEKEKTNGND